MPREKKNIDIPTMYYIFMYIYIYFYFQDTLQVTFGSYLCLSVIATYISKQMVLKLLKYLNDVTQFYIYIYFDFFFSMQRNIWQVFLFVLLQRVFQRRMCCSVSSSTAHNTPPHHTRCNTTQRIVTFRNTIQSGRKCVRKRCNTTSLIHFYVIGFA